MDPYYSLIEKTYHQAWVVEPYLTPAADLHQLHWLHLPVGLGVGTGGQWSSSGLMWGAAWCWLVPGCPLYPHCTCPISTDCTFNPSHFLTVFLRRRWQFPLRLFHIAVMTRLIFHCNTQLWAYSRLISSTIEPPPYWECDSTQNFTLSSLILK